MDRTEYICLGGGELYIDGVMVGLIAGEVALTRKKRTTLSTALSSTPSRFSASFRSAAGTPSGSTVRKVPGPDSESVEPGSDHYHASDFVVGRPRTAGRKGQAQHHVLRQGAGR